jgi:FlaA1/EpsC-like NDP-sugar epimerase
MEAHVILEGKRVLITGGTGSLGQRVTARILAGELGRPSRVTVFSRDEAKQHEMRLSYRHRRVATDEIIYRNFQDLLAFRIGDMRDYPSVVQALRGADVVVHTAALKQVPTCEYFPFEAVQTNIIGAQHLVRAVHEPGVAVEAVVGVSTDKACKPINVMGMTKAMMERIIVEANMDHSDTRFGCVRYGNVIASRGSVVPLFLEQIAQGGPVTITTREMTRFLLSLDQAVDVVFAFLRSGRRGDTYVPMAPAARMVDLADVLIAGRPLEIMVTGIRPGEKIHEILISEEECYRTIKRDGYFVIQPMLAELSSGPAGSPALDREFSSSQVNLDHAAIRTMLMPYVESAPAHSVTR